MCSTEKGIKFRAVPCCMLGTLSAPTNAQSNASVKSRPESSTPGSSSLEKAPNYFCAQEGQLRSPGEPCGVRTCVNLTSQRPAREHTSPQTEFGKSEPRLRPGPNPAAPSSPTQDSPSRKDPVETEIWSDSRCSRNRGKKLLLKWQ